MNNLIIPSSPNWYESRILACSVDNTVVYGTRNEIVVIYHTDEDKEAVIKMLPPAHFGRILSVDVNQNWGPGNKFIVSASDDRTIHLWDAETCTLKLTNNIHTTRTDKLVGSVFMGIDKIVSASENGFISLWRFNSGDIVSFKNLFTSKTHITTLSACPHVTWMVAFGLHCGLVVIADLRKTGRVIYKLRGHDKSVVSLSWCPTPYNIYPKKMPISKKVSTATQNVVAEELVNSNVGHDQQGVKLESSVSDTKLEEGVNDFLTECKVLEDKMKMIQTENVDCQHGKEKEISQLEKNSFKDDESTEIISLQSEDRNDFLTECKLLEDKIKMIQTEDMGCKHEEEKTDLMSQIDINSIKDENTEITSSQTTAQNIIESLLQTAEENPARSQEIKPENISETADDRDGNVSTVIEKTVNEIADIVSENLEKQTPDVEESNAMCLDTKDENQQGITTVRNKVDIKLCNVENEDVICNNTIKDDNEFQLNIDTEVQKIPTKEYLLASSARGGSIYIWRAGTDGRKETELFIGGNKNRRWKNTDKSWISLCWIAPDILLSSSPSAELLQWDLLKLNDKRVAQKKLIHHDHNNNLYVIAAPITLIHEWNKDIKRQNLFAWTTGQERYLLNTALQADRTLMASYPTIGGNVYTIRSSPLDPTRLAIGIGDNTAKIWDISRPHKQCITMANLWQKIQSKVLALAWHPKKETILAYATAEGRIGTVNTSSKSPSLLCQYFRNAIYDIHWGPIEGNIENLGLYAVGEGKLVVYNTAAETEDPKLVEPPSKEHIHCLAWKADFSLMACSTKTGSIIIYDISLNHITTIYSEYKSIYCVVWHPLATSQDEGTSSMASWLAISSSCTSVVVFDIPADKTNFEEKNKVAILNRHSRPVRCISWNPFVGGRIVSGGDDGVIFVWDVITQTVLATYLEHNIEPVLTVLWSPLDENFIISAGKDNCIRVWNVNEHKPKSDEEITNAHKIHSLFRYERKQFNKEINGDTEDEPLKVQRHVMLNLTSRAQNTPESVLNDCVRFYKTLNPDENAQLDAGSNLANGFDVLKLFGDKNSMMDLLNTEQKHHEEKKKSCFNQHIELWKGDIAAMVKNSIAQEKVSPWLISLAPMVSPELWKEACDVYAKKLMEDAKSDPLETVSYLLICHKVEEAIEVLCNATLFREALALAKCRLSKNDPIITDILKRWATFGILNGAYEMSTQCYIALGQYEEAAKALFRRTSIDALKFSVTLAEKSGNKDLIDACILRYNNFKNAGEGDESQNAEAMERDEMKDVGEKGDLVEKTEEASSQD